MPDIYHEARSISSLNKRLLFMVSTGRDSMCILELMKDLVDLPSMSFVHYSSFDPVLPYQSRILGYLEKRYSIRIEVRPDPMGVAYGLRGVAEDRDALLRDKNCELMVLGYRMDESLQRRGMLKSLTDGINPKTRECYPLRSWTSRITDAFVKARKIRLAPEYGLGLRDFRNVKNGKAYLLRLICEESYKEAVRQDPTVELDYVRYEKVRRDQLLAEIQDGADEEGRSEGGPLESAKDQRPPEGGPEE